MKELNLVYIVKNNYNTKRIIVLLNLICKKYCQDYLKIKKKYLNGWRYIKIKMAYPNNVQTKNTIYEDVNYIQIVKLKISSQTLSKI